MLVFKNFIIQTIRTSLRSVPLSYLPLHSRNNFISNKIIKNSRSSTNYKPKYLFSTNSINTNNDWIIDSISDQKAKQHYLQGKKLIQDNKFEEGVKQIQKAFSHQSNIDILYSAARNLIRNHNQHHYSALLYKDILQIDDKHLLSMLGLATCLFAQGDLQGAAMLYTRFLQLEPDNETIKNIQYRVVHQIRQHYNEIALQNYNQKQFSKAIDGFKKALQINDYLPTKQKSQYQNQTLTFLSGCYFNLGEVNLAFEQIDKNIQKYPKQYGSLFFKSCMLVQCEKYQQALQYLKRAESIKGVVNDQDLTYLKGYSKMKLNLYDEAIQDFNIALLKKEELIQKTIILKYLGECYLAINKPQLYKQSQKQLTKLIQIINKQQ